MIAVGVGKEVNKPELTSIAMGDVNHVFMVDQYTDLVKIINALLDKSCSGKFFRLKRKDHIRLKQLHNVCLILHETRILPKYLYQVETALKATLARFHTILHNSRESRGINVGI